MIKIIQANPGWNLIIPHIEEIPNGTRKYARSIHSIIAWHVANFETVEVTPITVLGLHVFNKRLPHGILEPHGIVTTAERVFKNISAYDNAICRDLSLVKEYPLTNGDSK